MIGAMSRRKTYGSVGRPRKSADERKWPPKAYYYEPDDEIRNGDPELDTYRFLLWGMRIRATIPRMQLLKFFCDGPKDLGTRGRSYTAEELAKHLSLSLATVYRTVSVLVRAGLLDVVCTGSASMLVLLPRTTHV